MATHYPLKDGTQWFDADKANKPTAYEKAEKATHKKWSARGGRPAKPLITVNVVERVNNYDIGIMSFKDNKAGNVAAEALFRTICKSRRDTPHLHDECI